MTTEEKAKAYEMALEAAREELKQDLHESGVWAIKRIFHELRESEDEELKNKSGYYKAGKFWKACTLWNAVKDKTPQRVPNRYILQECTWNISSLQHFADEVKNVQEVDLNYPIILDMNGNILDGAHRVVKAYLEGKDIDIVYLGDDEWPEPDYDEEKAVKESDDERIRKGLIEALKTLKTVGELKFILPESTREECIAYLEKQKETKPALSEVELLFRGEKVTVKRQFYRDDKGHGYSTTEQDEEVAWNALRAWCEKKGISLYDLYPKVEWGEEDETVIEGACSVLEVYGHTKLASMLRSLRPQPKQEWNEEDEKHINLILRVLDIQQCWDGATGKKFNPYQGEIDWLKSLRPRPSWKPSDKQMNCLCAAVDAAIRKHNESVSGYEPARVLKSLYEQLQKTLI